MKFVINHTPKDAGGEFCVRLTGDVRQDAKRISTLFPGEVVIVWAMSRARLAVQDGEVIRECPSIDTVYDLSGNHQADAIRYQWTHLLGSVDLPGGGV